MNAMPPIRPRTKAQETALSRNDGVDALIRKLLAKVPRHPSGHPIEKRDPGSAESAIVLEHEVDGFRCVLSFQGEDQKEIPMSQREREIADLVSRGFANKTIADTLGISSWTVSTHLRRIFAKLRVSSRAAMVAQICGRPGVGTRFETGPVFPPRKQSSQ